jgi:hypothetical protein
MTSLENYLLLYSTTNITNAFIKELILIENNLHNLTTSLLQSIVLFSLFTAAISHCLASIKLSSREQLFLKYRKARPLITLDKIYRIQNSNTLAVLRKRIGSEKWNLLTSSQQMELIDHQLNKTSGYRQTSATTS